MCGRHALRSFSFSSSTISQEYLANVQQSCTQPNEVFYVADPVIEDEGCVDSSASTFKYQTAELLFTEAATLAGRAGV